MGHSMGAGSAMMYACTLPDKVNKLILIDGIKPIQVSPCKQPERTAKFLNKMFEFEKKLQTSPPSYDYNEIVDRMVKSYSYSLTENSAKIMLKRGSAPKEDGKYSFTYDPLLKQSNAFSMCHEQQKAFAEQIKSEILVLRASKSPLFEDKIYYDDIIHIFQNKSPNFIFKHIEGTHHLHLNTPELIVPIISDFLSNNKALVSEL